MARSKYRAWVIMVDRENPEADEAVVDEMLCELERLFGLECLGTVETKTHPDFIIRESYPPLFGTPALLKKKR